MNDLATLSGDVHRVTGSVIRHTRRFDEEFLGHDIMTEPHEPMSHSEDSPIVSELAALLPDARDRMAFLRKIRGQDNARITDVVNQFVKEGRFSPYARSVALLRILRRYGIYTSTQSNWYNRVEWR